jgi:uncharacterized protein with von Willebrand factor type A (vWA) domain
MIPVITGFIDELRDAGVPVSMVEAIDAMQAVETIDMGSRVALRETLRATLVKNLRHERAFDTAFDIYFANVPAPTGETVQTPDDTRDDGSKAGNGQGGPGEGPMDEEELFRALLCIGR